MTAAIALAALTVGATGGSLVTYRWHQHRLDKLGYTRVRNEATRARELFQTADHEHRLRLRLEAMYDELAIEAREWIGDLLDKVADRDRVIAQLRRPRHRRVPPYSPERWSYGVHAA